MKKIIYHIYYFKTRCSQLCSVTGFGSKSLVPAARVALAVPHRLRFAGAPPLTTAAALRRVRITDRVGQSRASRLPVPPAPAGASRGGGSSVSRWTYKLDDLSEGGVLIAGPEVLHQYILISTGVKAVRLANAGLTASKRTHTCAFRQTFLRY